MSHKSQALFTVRSSQDGLERYTDESEEAIESEVIKCCCINCERHPKVFSAILLSLGLIVFVTLIVCIMYFEENSDNFYDNNDDDDDDDEEEQTTTKKLISTSISTPLN